MFDKCQQVDSEVVYAEISEITFREIPEALPGKPEGASEKKNLK